MKSRNRSIIEAVQVQLGTVAAGPYVHNFHKVEGGQRNFDVEELEQGVCVCVAFAGTSLRSKATGAPQQVSTLDLVVEAHKFKNPASDVQLEGLDLLADLELALLGDTTYLGQPYVQRRDAASESESVEISDDGTAIIATLVINIPYIKHYAKPHEE